MSNESELRRLKKTLEDIPNNFKGRIEEILEEEAQASATTARQLVPKDMGELAKSLKVISDPNLNTEDTVSRSVLATAPYAPYVEFGTKSRASVPPEWNQFANEFKGGTKRGGAFERIMEWARRKGFDEERSMAIYLSIMRFGIHPSPFMYPAFIKGRETIIKRLRKAFEKLR